MMNLLEPYMVVVSMIGAAFHYVQIYRLISTRSAKDLSFTAYIISLFANLNWLAYGWIIDSPILIFANFLSTAGAAAIIVGILKYRENATK